MGQEVGGGINSFIVLLFCFLPLQRTFGPEKGVLKLNKEMKYVAEVSRGREV
jgi:hypothetical protein